MIERRAPVLRHRETGQIFAWTEALAQRADMESVVAVFAEQKVLTPPRTVQEVAIPTAAIVGSVGNGQPPEVFPGASLDTTDVESSPVSELGAPVRDKTQPTPPELPVLPTLPIAQVPTGNAAPEAGAEETADVESLLANLRG
jgi:hypothetical protein